MSDYGRRTTSLRLQRLQRAADRSRANRHAAETAHEDVLALQEVIRGLRDRAEYAEQTVVALREQIERAESNDAAQVQPRQTPEPMVLDLQVARRTPFQAPISADATGRRSDPVPPSQATQHPPQASPPANERAPPGVFSDDNGRWWAPVSTSGLLQLPPRSPSPANEGNQSPAPSEYTVNGDDENEGTASHRVEQMRQQIPQGRQPGVTILLGVPGAAPGQAPVGTQGSPFIITGPVPGPVPAGRALNAAPNATLGNNSGTDEDGQPTAHQCYGHHPHRYHCFDWHDKYTMTNGPVKYELSTASGEDIPVVRDDDDLTCPICLEAYKQGDRVLPLLCEKKHRFHAACIGRWHDDKGLNCPMCHQQFAWTLAREDDGLTMTTVVGSNTGGDRVVVPMTRRI